MALADLEYSQPEETDSYTCYSDNRAGEEEEC